MNTLPGDMPKVKQAWVFEVDDPDLPYAVYFEGADRLVTRASLQEVTQLAVEGADYIAFSEEPPDFLFDE